MSGTLVHNLTYEDYIALDKLDDDQVKLLKEMMDSDLWDSYYDVAGGGAVAELAMTKIGCHYSQERRYEEGYYDCSSLVQRLYKEVGINLPATASTQGEYCYQNAMIINNKDLKPGDLIFYSYKENGEFRNISHVAIYVGDGKMVHAANENRGVVLDPLRTNHVVFYARHCFVEVDFRMEKREFMNSIRTLQIKRKECQPSGRNMDRVVPAGHRKQIHF